jgi:arylformamidase
LRERLLERRAAAAADHPDLADDDHSAASARALPEGTRVLRDVAYGSDPNQRFDVYAAPDARNAPVILMVHGGGWSRGDKAAAQVVDNKLARWLPAGFVVISTNYRMLPQTAPLEQARDVARALAAAQAQAASWGGERGRFILMGHSAGAHLVALLNASPAIATQLGAAPWLGTVALDSAALDVVQTMEGRHFRLHDRAFGRNPADWRAASPYQQLGRGAPPLLAVCSLRRDDSCAQARRLEAKARRLGLRSGVLERDLSHKQINQQLGEDGDYTRAVEAFMASLDPVVARALARRPR